MMTTLMDIDNNDNRRHDAATSDATTSDANEDYREGGQYFLCCFRHMNSTGFFVGMNMEMLPPIC
jgi:hypothetical protein